MPFIAGEISDKNFKENIIKIFSCLYYLLDLGQIPTFLKMQFNDVIVIFQKRGKHFIHWDVE